MPRWPISFSSWQIFITPAMRLIKSAACWRTLADLLFNRQSIVPQIWGRYGLTRFPNDWTIVPKPVSITASLKIKDHDKEFRWVTDNGSTQESPFSLVKVKLSWLDLSVRNNRAVRRLKRLALQVLWSLISAKSVIETRNQTCWITSKFSQPKKITAVNTAANHGDFWSLIVSHMHSNFHPHWWWLLYDASGSQKWPVKELHKGNLTAFGR